MSGRPSKPRVLIIPASYFAENRTVGGGERYALDYARSLSALTPTTLGLFGVEPAQERQEGSLTHRRFRVRSYRERFSFPMTMETWGAWRDYDVIHAMVFPTMMADMARLSGWWRGQKVVLTDVGGGGRCWSTMLSRIHPGLSLNRRADGLAFLSDYSAGFFQDWRQPRTSLYGGVTEASLERPVGQPEGYALFVGRLLPHKGVLELIQAVTERTDLVVVGRPYDKDYVTSLQRAAVGKRVEFVFDADDDTIQRLYAGANVVLQPSLPLSDKSELLGLVALEGMAAGKPVIVTRTTSLPELVVDGQTGFIVPPGDLTALRERIEMLVKNSNLSLEMGRCARAHVRAKFTWTKAAERGLALYRRLLGQTTEAAP